MTDMTPLSAVGIARSIRDGHTTAADAVEACLARIEEANVRINAVTLLRREAARAEALQADSVPRNARGPLHGVPFTAKDVFEVAGEEATAGLMERRGVVSTTTAVAVERLRRAGAILVAKSNCPPGGSGGESVNEIHGRTLNPHDPNRTPGGSSGGEAALVGAGASPLGLGSDSGGSLRLPAHFCGVFSFKPTTGRVPNTGAINHPGGLSDPRTQIGPIAQCVEDLEVAFAVLSGADGHDSGCFVTEPYERSGASHQPLLSDVKVGYFSSDGVHEPLASIQEAVLNAVRILETKKGSITRALPYDALEALELTHRYWNGSELPGGGYVSLLADWDHFRTNLYREFLKNDVYIGPVCANVAPPHGGVDAASFAYTLPYSLLGSPCLVVPMGFDPSGLPLGIQLVAAPWNERLLFRIASALEEGLNPLAPAPAGRKRQVAR